MAFWVNAYNAFVLQTVDRPLSDPRHERRLSGVEHPADSRRVRQTEAPRRRPERDARRDREDHPAGVQGAAAVSGARPRRRRQRPAAQRGVHRGAPARAARRDPAEFVTRQRLFKIDRDGRRSSRRRRSSAGTRPSSSPAYGGKADERFAQRSPIERAIIAFITPHLLPLEKEFVEKNKFRVTFQEFDWRLNDLTGGRIE